MGKKFGLYMAALLILTLPLFIWMIAKDQAESLNDSDENLKAILQNNSENTVSNANSAPLTSPAASASQTKPPAPPPAPVSSNTSSALQTEPKNDGQESPASEPPQDDSNVTEKKHFTSTQVTGLSFDYDESFTVTESNGKVSISKDEKLWTLKTYDNKDAMLFEDWFKDKFGSKKSAGCTFLSAAISMGSLTTKNVTKGENGELDCEDPGVYGMTSDQKKIVRLETQESSNDDIKDILSSIKLE